jgi:putative colanic acid biosynthesis acetyltransferase WcaB
MSWFAYVVRTDFDRYLNGRTMGVRNALGAIFRNEGLQAMLVYRFGRLLFARKRRLWWWPALILGAPVYALGALYVRKCFGINLYMSARIGAGCSILHFGAIEVRNCCLGEGCSIAHQTTIGRESGAPGPQVGDGVWIGPHSTILAAVTVGDGATIAPGSRVIRNVPKRSLVVGDPARIVSRSYDNTAMHPQG